MQVSWMIAINNHAPPQKQAQPTIKTPPRIYEAFYDVKMEIRAFHIVFASLH